MKTTWFDWFFVIAILATLMIGAAFAYGQPQGSQANLPQQAPPVVPPQAPPVLPAQAPPVSTPKYLSYSRAETYPIVVFVGVKPREVDGVQACYEPSGFMGYKEAVIVFPKDGRGYAYGSNISDDAIRREAGLEVRRLLPTPFRKLRAGEVPPFADGSIEDVAGRLPFLRDLVSYTTAQNTQTTFRRWSGVIVPSPRASLENKWRVPGGMDGVHGWSSQLLRGKDAIAQEFLVRQDPNDNSSAITWGRRYPDGSIFADVLRNEKGVVFEVRVAHKREGAWDRFVVYHDKRNIPNGYIRLSSKECAVCHNAAGRSEYAGAAIPGADGILSDPLSVVESGQSVQGGSGLSLGR